MRVLIGQKQVVLSGKAWEIQALLKQYSKQHKLVKDWLDSCTFID